MHTHFFIFSTFFIFLFFLFFSIFSVFFCFFGLGPAQPIWAGLDPASPALPAGVRHALLLQQQRN
jgi:hypothetical protein